MRGPYRIYTQKPSPPSSSPLAEWQPYLLPTSRPLVRILMRHTHTGTSDLFYPALDKTLSIIHINGSRNALSTKKMAHLPNTPTVRQVPNNGSRYALLTGHPS